MLVLTRRLNERIFFPSLNVSMEVVGIKSGAVRLGIDAPPEVAILREEVRASRSAAEARSLDRLPDAGPEARRRSLAGWLKLASMKLGMARLQLQAGQAKEGQAALEALHDELQFLRDQLASQGDRLPHRPAEEGDTPFPAPAHKARRNLLAACVG
jgi:carbon storage regulator